MDMAEHDGYSTAGNTMNIVFWTGFAVMVLNEGFVIMRHVHPWFAWQRERLIRTYGAKWKRFHATLDYVWIGGVTVGVALDYTNWKFYATVLGVFWGFVAVSVYIPLLIKKIAAKR